MSLSNYGALRGKVLAGKREEKLDSPHYQVHLLSGSDHYRIAVNVKSQTAPSELLFLVDENFRHPILSRLADLPAGFTPLASRPDSGALDYIRGNLFSRMDMRQLPFDLPGQDNDLNDKIEHFVNRAKLDSEAEVFAFGEQWGPESARDKIFRFKPGQGIHDIHMNQGNVERFVNDDGVWQDGGLIFHFPRLDQWVAVFLAFQSQAWHTDDRTGHALPTPPPDEEPTEERDFVVRIVGAMANPIGPAPENEYIILLNTSPNPIDLTGWAIADKQKNKHLLSGSIAAGSPLVVAVKPPAQLSNKGGIITLLDNQGLKVDGVSYTLEQARQEGWVITF